MNPTSTFDWTATFNNTADCVSFSFIFAVFAGLL